MSIAITLEPLLDATSLAVKAILQTYPGAYKTRLDVLARLFLQPHSNGLVDGAPDLSCFGPLAEQMDYSDLDEQLARLDLNAANDINDPMATLFASRAVALKRQYADRQLAERYIEIIANTHSEGESFQITAKLVRDFRAGASLLDRVDVGTMSIS